MHIFVGDARPQKVLLSICRVCYLSYTCTTVVSHRDLQDIYSWMRSRSFPAFGSYPRMRVQGRCAYSGPLRPHAFASSTFSVPTPIPYLIPQVAKLWASLRSPTVSISLNSHRANSMDSLMKLLRWMGAPPLLNEGFMSILAQTSNCAPNPSFPQRKSLSLGPYNSSTNSNPSNSSFHKAQAG